MPARSAAVTSSVRSRRFDDGSFVVGDDVGDCGFGATPRAAIAADCSRWRFARPLLQRQYGPSSPGRLATPHRARGVGDPGCPVDPGRRVAVGRPEARYAVAWPVAPRAQPRRAHCQSQSADGDCAVRRAVFAVAASQAAGVLALAMPPPACSCSSPPSCSARRCWLVCSL